MEDRLLIVERPGLGWFLIGFALLAAPSIALIFLRRNISDFVTSSPWIAASRTATSEVVLIALFVRIRSSVLIGPTELILLFTFPVGAIMVVT